MPQAKIATCCYCGTRAALVLDGTRHELMCSSCGAPLHDLKRLPKAATTQTPARNRPSTPAPKHDDVQPYAPRKHAGRGRLRKRFVRRLVAEVFDVIEDIFD